MAEQPALNKLPRILLYDIESAPNLGWTWGKYEQDVIDFRASWYILSFAYKWLGEKRIHTVALPDFPNYKKDKEDDAAVVGALYSLFCEADVLVAHNGDKFDQKKVAARAIKHGLGPWTPTKSVDTLKIARNRFAFTSNKLDDLGAYLGIGRKLPNTGFVLWRGCMEGDPKAWATMRRYNTRDVELLEQVYLRLRPWHVSHPRLTAYTDRPGCPCCQSKEVQARGFNIAVHRRTPRWHCQGCGHWFSGKMAA